MTIRKIVPYIDDGSLMKSVNSIIEVKEEVLLKAVVPYFNHARRMSIINVFKNQFNNN